MDRNTKVTFRRVAIAGALGLSLVSLVAISAQARGPRGSGPAPDRAVARLTERLDLSADQQTQVKTILEESFAKQKETRDAHRKEMEALREATDANLAKVLTPEQMQKLHELRDRREGRRGDCGRGPGHWRDRKPPTE